MIKLSKNAKLSQMLATVTFQPTSKKNKDFQTFAKNFTLEVVEPINPQHAFYGGKTNATKLLYNFKDNECGRYVDFCSLYPTVQYYQKYPIGHPKKIYIYIYIRYKNKIYFQEIKWRKQFQIQNYLFSENFYTRRFDLKKPSSVVL